MDFITTTDHKKGEREIELNTITYKVSDDAAAIVHALICLIDQLQDIENLLGERLPVQYD